MAKKSKRSKRVKIAAEVGAGLAAAAIVAAAGAYYFSGKKGKARRKVVKKWAGAAKKETIRELKKLKKIDRKDCRSSTFCSDGKYV